MFGVGIGSPVLGKLSDTYGRWNMMLLSMTFQLSSAIIAAFSYNYTMLLVVFFMIGITLVASLLFHLAMQLNFFLDLMVDLLLVAVQQSLLSLMCMFV